MDGSERSKLARPATLRGMSKFERSYLPKAHVIGVAQLSANAIRDQGQAQRAHESSEHGGGRHATSPMAANSLARAYVSSLGQHETREVSSLLRSEPPPVIPERTMIRIAN